jgi:hypothetical protein
MSIPDITEIKKTSWHYRSGFRRQFQCAYRWKIRLVALHSEPSALRANDPCISNDYLLTFFKECFAIRDWAKTEPQWKNIEKKVNSHPILMICRDIANVSKHKELNSPSVDGDFAFGTAMGSGRPALFISPGKLVPALRKSVAAMLTEQGRKPDEKAINTALTVLGIPVSPNIPHIMDALALADTAIQAWEGLLLEGKFLDQVQLDDLKNTAFNHHGF